MKTKFLLTMTLCLIASVSFSQLKSLAGVGMSDEEKAAKEEQKRIAEAKFEGRPTSPSDEVANYNDNVPAKKETFESKMARFKAEGFQVAVVLESGEIGTLPYQPVEKEEWEKYHNIALKGSVPSMANDLEAIREGYIAKMNEAFKTDLFVPVDMKDIPYRENKGSKKDNWEETKYRVYVIMSMQPYYLYGVKNKKKDAPGDYTNSFYINVYAPIYEVYNDKSKIKIKQHITNSALGSYKSEEYAFDAPPEISTVEELAALVETPSSEELVTKLQEAFDARIEKYIEKVK